MAQSEERVISPQPQAEDVVDAALRPQKLVDVIGQDKVKANLEIVVEAALARKEPLDHILFYGPLAWARLRLRM